jgi:hypothetical protein
LATNNITTPNFDANLLLEPLWKNDLVPSNVKLGLIEFGAENFYAADNVTFTISDFAVNITTNSSTSSSTSSSTGSSTSSSTNSPTKTPSSDSPPSLRLIAWYSYGIWSAIALIIVSWM